MGMAEMAGKNWSQTTSKKYWCHVLESSHENKNRTAHMSHAKYDLCACQFARAKEKWNISMGGISWDVDHEWWGEKIHVCAHLSSKLTCVWIRMTYHKTDRMRSASWSWTFWLIDESSKFEVVYQLLYFRCPFKNKNQQIGITTGIRPIQRVLYQLYQRGWVRSGFINQQTSNRWGHLVGSEPSSAWASNPPGRLLTVILTGA